LSDHSGGLYCQYWLATNPHFTVILILACREKNPKIPLWKQDRLFITLRFTQNDKHVFTMYCLRLLLRQQYIAIAAVVRYWAKALINFALSAYPGLKSGAIVQEFSWADQ
jgi:hypothetical protein